MAKRITVMIDDDLDKKIRVAQAKKIQSDVRSVSYSEVLNEILQMYFKK